MSRYRLNPKRAALAVVFSLLAVRCIAATAGSSIHPVSVNKIWDAAGHNAFTDLARFQQRWFCTFREAEGHVQGNGKIRVLTSTDGKEWTSAALLAEAGIDLRDPKLSITPNNRLMLVMGGSVYEGKVLKGRRSRVSFSQDGTDWTTPQAVLEKGDWLWRVTWYQGKAYGIAYESDPATTSSAGGPPEWATKLVVSDDGVGYRLVTRLEVPGRANEGTLRFLSNGDCVALLRREGLPHSTDRDAWIGLSHPPYLTWQWHPAGLPIGGPNFLVLPDGRMIASGRFYGTNAAAVKTFVGAMDLQSVHPDVLLPSGGDCSYPGLVWDDGLLWMSYYSSHEGKTSVYLAKFKLLQTK